MMNVQAPRLINYSIAGSVGIISLNRPEKLNAINQVMVSQLGDALDEAETDDNVRVILLKGEGKAFSAGFDLEMENDGKELSESRIREELARDFEIIMRFWDCPKPTIAAVHKYCLGSGMEMAVACDITIAAEECRFGAPEVKFGSGIVSLILPWVIGVKQAKELLLTGDDKVSSQRALALGLINKVVKVEQLENEALSMANNIAANDTLAVKLTKQAINRSCELMGMRDALLQALELDIEIESTETPESRDFNRILKEQGTKAAIAWRENKIKQQEN